MVNFFFFLSPPLFIFIFFLVFQGEGMRRGRAMRQKVICHLLTTTFSILGHAWGGRKKKKEINK